MQCPMSTLQLEVHSLMHTCLTILAMVTGSIMLHPPKKRITPCYRQGLACMQQCILVCLNGSMRCCTFAWLGRADREPTARTAHVLPTTQHVVLVGLHYSDGSLLLSNLSILCFFSMKQLFCVTVACICQPSQWSWHHQEEVSMVWPGEHLRTAFSRRIGGVIPSLCGDRWRVQALSCGHPGDWSR